MALSVFLLKSDIFIIAQKVGNFWATLCENLLPRSFKSGPIWSHCRRLRFTPNVSDMGGGKRTIEFPKKRCHKTSPNCIDPKAHCGNNSFTSKRFFCLLSVSSLSTVPVPYYRAKDQSDYLKSSLKSHRIIGLLL